MAFKMNKHSMINVSYNKKSIGISPLNNDPDPKKKLKDISKVKTSEDKLTKISGPKAKSQKARSLKPLVKTVNTLTSQSVASTGRSKISPSGTLETKGNRSFSSEVTKNRGSVDSMGVSDSTTTTNINASSSANGAKNFNKTKTKNSWDGTIMPNQKNKKTNITANVDQSGNKSFTKNKKVTKSAGILVDQLVPFGHSEISGSKNKTVSISAESNIDGSKSFSKNKIKQGEVSLGGYNSSPKIPTSNKEKSLNVNVGADGSKQVIQTKKKKLFGWTKKKTVTYTKN
mgnify:CR=1 FL=1|jgi:hypothetical protein|tara:strand:+ start:56 stop:913 length:858 start_codon:yes stop_codon:yes gene_type:complete